VQTIPSNLTSKEQEFVPFRKAAAQRGFVLGGGWDYDHGSFDCALDDEHTVWLRIPFEVISGHLDSESDDSNARIRFGEPYVLKHLYREGSDHEAQARIFGALTDQFSDPSNPDAEIEPRWIDEAKRKLSEIEAICFS
jgi:hypothetical protein